MEDLKEVLSYIKSISIKSLDDYLKIKKGLYDNLFSKLPVIVQKIPKGIHVFRTVKVFRNDLTVGRTKYLSYRPSEVKYTKFNRCSEPDQTHFYCSTTKEASVFETTFATENIDEPNPIFSKDEELLEIGMWEVQRDLYVVDFRYGSHSTPETVEIKNNLIDTYHSNFKDETIREIFSFMNSCFQKPIKANSDIDYWLTACCSNYIFDDQYVPKPDVGNLHELKGMKTVSVDGIIFQSVKGLKTNPQLHGDNIVLRPSLIDTKALKLEKALICLTKKIGETEFNLDVPLKIQTKIEGNAWYYDLV